MEQINLLIVEDEESAVISFKNVLEEFPEIILDVAYNLDETVKYLSAEKEYQIIIVDLKLGKDDEEYKGNYVLNLLKKHKKCVKALHTGNSEENDDDENDFFKRYKRGDIKIKDMIQELISDYNNLKLEIDFYNYIEDTLVKEISTGNLNEIKDKIDQIIPHTNEYYSLLLEHIVFSKEDKSQKINTNLLYIPKKMIKKHYPGCIYEKDGKFYFLITPACDISQNNTDKFHYIECTPLQEFIDANPKKYFMKAVKGTREKYTKEHAEKGLEKEEVLSEAGLSLKNQPKNSSKFFVLPKGLFLNTDFVLQLHNIHVFNKTELKLTDVRCQLITRITKDVINKFGAFFGNQGSPDFKI